MIIASKQTLFFARLRAKAYIRQWNGPRLYKANRDGKFAAIPSVKRMSWALIARINRYDRMGFVGKRVAISSCDLGGGEQKWARVLFVWLDDGRTELRWPIIHTHTPAPIILCINQPNGGVLRVYLVIETLSNWSTTSIRIDCLQKNDNSYYRYEKSFSIFPPPTIIDNKLTVWMWSIGISCLLENVCVHSGKFRVVCALVIETKRSIGRVRVYAKYRAEWMWILHRMRTHFSFNVPERRNTCVALAPYTRRTTTWIGEMSVYVCLYAQLYGETVKNMEHILLVHSFTVIYLF